MSETEIKRLRGLSIEGIRFMLAITIMVLLGIVVLFVWRDTFKASLEVYRLLTLFMCGAQLWVLLENIHFIRKMPRGTRETAWGGVMFSVLCLFLSFSFFLGFKL